MREVREKEPALYRRFLKHEAVRSDIRNDYSDVFNGVPNDLIIQAANAAELFSFTVVSRILVWYLAEMATKMEIDELVKLLDGTPLDKKILEEFEVEADDAIWQTCPGMKKSVFEAN
uniref:SKP1 component dimerisation domain-containing protein n=1 Tax=Panagrolaimus sp. JU765 TaxID=591449 RepID=A0AC34R7T7_9BILA